MCPRRVEGLGDGHPWIALLLEEFGVYFEMVWPAVLHRSGQKIDAALKIIKSDFWTK